LILASSPAWLAPSNSLNFDWSSMFAPLRKLLPNRHSTEDYGLLFCS
jgi:hypothetical protein